MQTGALHRPRPEVHPGAQQGLQAGANTEGCSSSQAKLQVCAQAALCQQQPAGAQDCPRQVPQEGLR